MPRNGPPAPFERLLEDPTGSVGTLELVLVLHRRPRREWTLDELRAALSSPETWTSQQLGALERADLVARVDGGWRYAPGSERLDGAVNELAALWEADRRRITKWAFKPRSRRRRGRARG